MSFDPERLPVDVAALIEQLATAQAAAASAARTVAALQDQVEDLKAERDEARRAEADTRFLVSSLVEDGQKFMAQLCNLAKPPL